MKLQQTQVPDFEWPTYKTDSIRIKELSTKYKHMCITDAFSDYYGITVDKKIKEKIESIQLIDSNPIGTILRSVVLQSNDGIIYFPNIFSNKEIICKHNPSQIASLINTESDIEIVQSSDKFVRVDLIKPIRDRWIKEALESPHKYVLTVTDLKLTQGGFIGKMEIPYLSNILNTKWEELVYIPGSQIELNIETNFKKWEGATVQTYLTNYIPSNKDFNKPTLILSVKKFYQHLGDINLVNLYKMYCDDSGDWDKERLVEYKGIVTGILNSKTTKGVFVEIPMLKINGLYKCDYKEMVKYSPSQKLTVSINEFAPLTRLNKTTGQTYHIVPYEIKDGVIVNNKLNIYLKILS